MDQHRVVLLPGDGIGPEITAVARQLLEAVATRFGFRLLFERITIAVDKGRVRPHPSILEG